MSSAPGFKLIRLSEVPRPVRTVVRDGAFSLFRFRSRAELMAQTELKYSDFLSWTRPRDALAALDAVYRKPASTRHLLLERLKSGKILAIAESSTWRGIRGDKTGVLAVKRDEWDHFAAGEEFWQSGDLHLYLGYYQGNASSVEVWYHAIRFDPDGPKSC